MQSFNNEIDDFGTKLKLTPDDVRSSLNHVISYFTSDAKNDMLNDGMMRPGFSEEVEEEAEEKVDFDPSRQLEIMLNPLEHTNRFLRYEFMKERNGITQESDARSNYCDIGWKNVDGLCWKMIRQDLTKLEAKQECMIKNADLVKPDNKRDNRNIAEFIWSEEARSCVWLGGFSN